MLGESPSPARFARDLSPQAGRGWSELVARSDSTSPKAVVTSADHSRSLPLIRPLSSVVHVSSRHPRSVSANHFAAIRSIRAGFDCAERIGAPFDRNFFHQPRGSPETSSLPVSTRARGAPARPRNVGGQSCDLPEVHISWAFLEKSKAVARASLAIAARSASCARHALRAARHPARDRCEHAATSENAGFFVAL